MTTLIICAIVMTVCTVIGTFANLFTMIDNRKFLVGSLRKNIDTLRNSILHYETELRNMNEELNIIVQENQELRKLLEVK